MEYLGLLDGDCSRQTTSRALAICACELTSTLSSCSQDPKAKSVGVSRSLVHLPKHRETEVCMCLIASWLRRVPTEYAYSFPPGSCCRPFSENSPPPQPCSLSPASSSSGPGGNGGRRLVAHRRTVPARLCGNCFNVVYLNTSHPSPRPRGSCADLSAAGERLY